MVTQDRWTARLTIPFATLLIGLTLTAAALLLLLWLRNWQASLDEIVKVIATGIGATTALYAALNLARLNAAHVETVELKKLELTAKFIERWQDPKVGDVVKPVNAFLKTAPTLTPAELAKKIDEDEALRASAMFVLNTLEALAVQLKYNALQPEMARAFFRGVVVTYQTKLSGLIALGRNRTENSRLFVELDELARLWSSK